MSFYPAGNEEGEDQSGSSQKNEPDIQKKTGQDQKEKEKTPECPGRDHIEDIIPLDDQTGKTENLSDAQPVFPQNAIVHRPPDDIEGDEKEEQVHRIKYEQLQPGDLGIQAEYF